MEYNSKTTILGVSDTKVYRTRWYVITIVSLTSVLNNMFWASWGPISQSMELVYGWSDSTLFWVVNIGNISGFILTMFGSYLIVNKGIRIAMIACTLSLVVTATSRIITTSQPAATILLSIGQFFTGFATAITTSIPPAVSEVWFHINERTTATAISATAAAAGGAAAFLFGPLVVSMPKMNGTTVLLNETDVSKIEHEMRTYNYINFGIAIALCLCSILYLPTKPPTPPSITAEASRFSFWSGFRTLIRIPSMWLIAATFAIPMGFYGNWSSMINVILGPEVITQEQAGWMSFSGNLAGVILAVIIARFVDKFKRKMKSIICVNYTIGTAMFIWFTLMERGWLPVKTGFLYTVVILVGATITGSAPLFIEISCETSYPVSEGVSAGFLGVMINLGASVVLALTQIKLLDASSWMNWMVSGVFVIALPLVALLKINYQRVTIDTGEDNAEPASGNTEKNSSININVPDTHM